MAKELVPLKVKIELTSNGRASYPNFNNLQIVKDSGLDWSKYIDLYSDGQGWHYDKESGHQESTIDSPTGQQWGMLLLTEGFVIQAVAAFPLQCSRLTELEAEDFYNNKAHKKDPDELINLQILQGIVLKQDLGLELTAGQIDAINPASSTPGIVINKDKIWNDHKTKVDIVIKEQI